MHPNKHIAEYIVIGTPDGYTVINGTFGGEAIYNATKKDDASALMSADEAVKYLDAKLKRDHLIMEERRKMIVTPIRGKDEWVAVYTDKSGVGSTEDAAVEALVDK